MIFDKAPIITKK